MWISLRMHATQATCTLKKRWFTRPECLSESLRAPTFTGTLFHSIICPLLHHTFFSFSDSTYQATEPLHTHQSNSAGAVKPSDPQSYGSSHLKSRYRPGNTACRRRGQHPAIRSPVGTILAVAVHTTNQEQLFSPQLQVTVQTISTLMPMGPSQLRSPTT